jgi:hypothetical protein
VTSTPPSETAKEPPQPERRTELARNILTASCTMIAMCATLVGLVKFVSAAKGFDTLMDECSALVGILFLGSAILSYVSIRSAHRPRLSQRLERCADVLFIMGLIGISGAILFLAFEII